MFTVLKFSHRSLRQQMAIVKKRHAIGNAASALNIVCHNDQRRVAIRLNVDQQLIDLRRGNRIESGAGLIDKEKGWLHSQGAGKSRALLHTAGEVAGHAVVLLPQAEHFENALSLAANLRIRLCGCGGEGETRRFRRPKWSRTAPHFETGIPCAFGLTPTRYPGVS